MGESGIEDPSFQCNICGGRAEFVVQLELARGAKRYNAFRAKQTLFYLCKAHEHVYKKMQRSIELKDYFTETIREHQ
ncbi:MAG: hypothetical protein AB1351_08345 [Thermoproteota archaeon]